MPFVMLLILGAAAGLLATKLMRINLDLPSTVALGVLGALIGGVVLRVLIVSLGMGAGIVGAVLGAMLLVYLWGRFKR